MRDLLFSYRPAVVKTIAKMVNSPETVEDLTQEVFYKALVNEHRYDLNLGAVSTWLITIAKNITIDFLRSAKNRVHNVNLDDCETLQADGACVLQQVQHDEMAYHLAMCIKDLSEREQLITRAFHFDRLKHKEIAEELNVSTAAVGTMVKRCNQKIKKNLQQRGITERDF